MRTFKTAFILLTLVLLSGCASIIDGPTQNVTLRTPGANEAECTLTNGVKYRALNGETVRIMRSHRDMVVDCYGAGDRHKQIVVASKFNEWGLTNVSNGVAPGTTYDHFSGGLYTYPEIITVDFTGMPTRGFETPAYHNKDAPNPYHQAIESYGASTPAVPMDSEYLPRGLDKRDENINSNPFSNVAPSAGGSDGMMPMAGSDAPYNGGGSGPKFNKSNLSGNNAEALTRSANPSVFTN